MPRTGKRSSYEVAQPGSWRINPSWDSLLFLGLLFGFFASFATLGCASREPGPAFVSAPAPLEPRGRIYLYRAEGRGGLSSVRVQIDGRPIGDFRSAEYETLELTQGVHELGASLRVLPYLPTGWNRHRFALQSGETIYLELELRIESRSASPPDLEIGGRSNEVLAENIYLRQRSESEALKALKATTRRRTEN